MRWKLRGQWQHWPLLVILVLIFLGYSNTWMVPFQFDDSTHLVWTEKTAKTPISSWVGETMIGYPHRVIPILTFVWQYRIWPNPPIPFLHFGNLAIHIINTSIVYLLTLIILKILARPVLSKRNTILFSVSVTAIFALHPVQTQAVTYLIQRMASLAATFFFGSVLLFLASIKASEEKQNLRSVILLCSSFIVGLASVYSKENTVVLPLIFGLLLWLCSLRINDRLRGLYLLVVGSSIFFSTLLVFSHQFNQGISTAPPSIAAIDSTRLNTYSYFLTQASLVPRYISLALLPIRQSVDHAPKLFNNWELPVFIGIIIWIALTLLIVYFRRRQPMIAFGLGWYLITMLVESSFIPISDPFVEHRLYLPLFGLVIATVYAIYLLLQRYDKVKYLIWLPIVLLAVMTAATYHRNLAWTSEISLWKDATINSPANPRAFYNLGVNLVLADRYSEALQAFLHAATLRPNYHFANNNAGALFFAIGDYRSAVRYFLQAVETKPNEELYQKNLALAINALDSDTPATASPEMKYDMFW